MIFNPVLSNPPLCLLHWRRYARLFIAALIAPGYFLLVGCESGDTMSTAQPKDAIQSVYTALDAGSCEKEIDLSDPNETPYLSCPGVAGYNLIVRRVDSGRQSIDVMDPEQRILPLDYQEFVTRYMTTLADRAEWRVAIQDGKQLPIALIVSVEAREDNDNPEKVTNVYVAVAKIAPNEACVTASIPAGTLSEAGLRDAADSAGARPCAPPQPRMKDSEAIIR